MADDKPTTDPTRYELEPGKHRVIDLVAIAKSRDPDTARQAQGFFEVAAATWFKWLGWLFAAGGVAYLAEITDDWVLRSISAVSQLLLAFYGMYFVFSIRVEPLWHRSFTSASKRRRAFLGALIMGLVVVLFLTVRYGMEHVVELIVESRRSGSG